MVKTERVGIQVEPEFFKRIEKFRTSEGVSISAVIRKLLSDEMERRGY